MKWTDALALTLDRSVIMAQAGLSPDPWQRDVLRSDAKEILLLCSRQAGKSTTSAAIAAAEAITTPDALVLLLSPSLRQSQELFRKVRDFIVASGATYTQESALRVEMASGSRVIALPGTEQTIRGYSEVALLVVDEAARVDDALYYAIRPMLAVSGGRIVALTTPYGRRGWFYEEWDRGGDRWNRYKITADQCPRIPAEFLAIERLALPRFWYAQEYECSFEETADTLFTLDLIRAAFTSDVAPYRFDSEPTTG